MALGIVRVTFRSLTRSPHPSRMIIADRDRVVANFGSIVTPSGQAMSAACLQRRDLGVGKAPLGERDVGMGPRRDRRAGTALGVRLKRGAGAGWGAPSTSTKVPRATLCGWARACAIGGTAPKQTSWPAKEDDPSTLDAVRMSVAMRAQAPAIGTGPSGRPVLRRQSRAGPIARAGSRRTSARTIRSRRTRRRPSRRRRRSARRRRGGSCRAVPTRRVEADEDVEELRCRRPSPRRPAVEPEVERSTKRQRSTLHDERAATAEVGRQVDRPERERHPPGRCARAFCRDRQVVHVVADVARADRPGPNRSCA